MSSESSQNKEINQIKVNFMAIQKDIDYTKVKVDSIEDKLDAFIDKANCTYATKQEMREQQERVQRINHFLNKVMWTSIVALLGFIATIFKEVIMSNL